MASAKRNGDVVDAALRDFMDRYPLPLLVVGSAWRGEKDGASEEMQRVSNAGSFVGTRDGESHKAPGDFDGLLTQSGQVIDSYLNDEPDLLWQTLFATFDENGDLPAMGIAAKDTIVQRAAGDYIKNRPRFDKKMEDAYRPKHARIISDNFTVINMVRRGRIDWLRPYAPLIGDTMIVKKRGSMYSRNWSEFSGWKKNPVKPFVPTRYVAKPWTPFQLDQYDHLENLGTLYRPQVVSYLDDSGHPVKTAERNLRMLTALRAALAPLDGKLPARILFDYGSVWNDRSSSTRFLPLVQGLHAIDEEFDLLDPQHGYDLSRILGDTGAGSSFVGVALASMASRQSGGATLVANLRRNDGATLLLVMPPTAEQVKKDAAITRPYFPSTDNAKVFY